MCLFCSAARRARSAPGDVDLDEFFDERVNDANRVILAAVVVPFAGDRTQAMKVLLNFD